MLFPPVFTQNHTFLQFFAKVQFFHKFLQLANLKISMKLRNCISLRKGEIALHSETTKFAKLLQDAHKKSGEKTNCLAKFCKICRWSDAKVGKSSRSGKTLEKATFLATITPLLIGAHTAERWPSKVWRRFSQRRLNNLLVTSTSGDYCIRAASSKAGAGQ